MPIPVTDISNRFQGHSRPWAGGGPRGIIYHDTGSPTLQSAINGLNAAGNSYNYIIDTDGTVYQFVPSGMSGGHAGVAIAPEYRRQGLGNRNMIGVSYVGEDSNHLTPQQQQAGIDLAGQLAQQYPTLDPSLVFGHGEFAPSHRDHSEGLQTASYIRDHGFGTAGDNLLSGNILGFDINANPSGRAQPIDEGTRQYYNPSDLTMGGAAGAPMDIWTFNELPGVGQNPNPSPHENSIPTGPGYIHDYQNPVPFEGMSPTGPDQYQWNSNPAPSENQFIPHEGYLPSLNNPAPYEQPFQSQEQYSYGYNPAPSEQPYIPSDFYQYQPTGNQGGNDLQNFGSDASLGSDVPSADQSLWFPTDYGTPQANQGGYDIAGFGGDMSLGDPLQPYQGPSGHPAQQQSDPGYTGPTSVEFPTQYGVYNGPVNQPGPVNQITPGVGFTNYGAGQYIPIGSNAPSNFYQFQYNSTPSTSGSGYDANMRARSLNISPFADVAGASSLLTAEDSGYGGGQGGFNAPHYQANMLRRMQGSPMGVHAMFDPSEGLQNPALDATRALLSGTQALRHVGT